MRRSWILWGLMLTISLDIQFVVGLILYVFLSPITRMGVRNLAAAMQIDDVADQDLEGSSIVSPPQAIGQEDRGQPGGCREQRRGRDRQGVREVGQIGREGNGPRRRVGVLPGW